VAEGLICLDLRISTRRHERCCFSTLAYRALFRPGFFLIGARGGSDRCRQLPSKEGQASALFFHCRFRLCKGALFVLHVEDVFLSRWNFPLQTHPCSSGGLISSVAIETDKRRYGDCSSKHPKRKWVCQRNRGLTGDGKSRDGMGPGGC
jgi:hypothetical protein